MVCTVVISLPLSFRLNYKNLWIYRFPASRKTNIGQLFWFIDIFFFQLFGFLLDKRKHQAAVILLIAAMSVQGVMNLKVQFVSTITPNKLVCERCIECIGNAITYFIGCCEVSQGAGSKFVPQNSSIMQFDTTPIQSWLFFFWVGD